MTDHSELLKKAREQADDLGAKSLSDEASAFTIRTLADIVEAHDKVLPGFRDTKNELLAACRTCDEAIAKLIQIDEPDSRTASACDCGTEQPRLPVRRWINLRAARHLAKRAVENAEKAKGL